MSIDTAMQRLRDANPVPDPAALRKLPVETGVLLTATQQRSNEMQPRPEPFTNQKAPTSQRRKWIPELAAAAVGQGPHVAEEATRCRRVKTQNHSSAGRRI